jgi:hypothetical protein
MAVSSASVDVKRTEVKRSDVKQSASKLQAAARRRFLDFYPRGFDDDDYIALERGYKWRAHEQWSQALSHGTFSRLIGEEQYAQIAFTALGILARTHLLFSFESMALRDAIRTKQGARIFAEGLYMLLHGDGSLDDRFDRWINDARLLPQKKSRVFTWPVLTVFPFIADPKRHLYLKPIVTQQAARRWGFDFAYSSKPTTSTYQSLLAFGRDVRDGLAQSRFPGRRARDQIDVQSFIWVLGSTEYD